MKTRVLTGMGLLAFMILLFFTKSITPYVFDAFIVYLAIVGGLEMSNLLSKFGYYNSKLAICVYPILSYGLFKLCTYLQLSLYLVFVLQIALLILTSAFVSLVCLMARKNSDNEIKTRKINCTIEQFSMFKGVQTLFATIYPAFLIMLLIYINNLESLQYVFVNITDCAYSLSLFLLVYTFVVPIFVDTFAMLTGSIFKGKKLCPKLSPKKTVSGAIGGLVWGVLSACALFFIFNAVDSFRVMFIAVNLTWWKVLIVGIISAVICQVGDLFESFLKRKANVKDSGDILPGHGGVLDRIDSHIANILVTFVFMLIILC